MRLFLFLLVLISPFIIKAQTDPLPDSETIEYSTIRQVENNKLTVTNKLLIQVNNRQGEDITKIYIPYTKGDKVIIQEAYISDMDGTIIRKLKNNEIEDRSFISEISLYEDDFVKSFELKHNQYPYLISYSYKISYNKFLQIASLDLTGIQYPIKKGEMIVKRPLNQPIKEKYSNILAYRSDTIENLVEDHWSFCYTPYKKERNSGYRDTQAPVITVVPVNFDYGKKGSWNNWNTFGNWLYLLNEDKDILPSSEIAKVDELLKGITDNKEKARILYQYLQEYNRYINVSIGIGGLQTYSAEYVCKNRYGDCKALTNYMRAILQYAGIKSYYTTINMNDKVKDIDPDFASQVFNHVILTIPFGNDTTYLECTSKHLPFGYIHTDIQGRKALLTDKEDSHLITIPSLQPDDVLVTRNFEFGTDGHIKLKTTLKGVEYEKANYLFYNAKSKEIGDYTRANSIPKSIYLIDAELINTDKENTSISLTANLKASNPNKRYGNNLIINPISNKVFSYEIPNKRTQDIQIDYPVYYKDTLVYKLDEYEINKIPETISYETKYGKYHVDYQLKDNEFFIAKSTLILAGYYPVDEYEMYYNFIQTIINNENKNIYLEIK